MADVRLPAIITAHMVVQADVKVPLWGWADPRETVTISQGGQTATATPGPDGKWLATLNPLKVSADPQTLIVQSKNKLIVQDVLIGEVWPGSRQSNRAIGIASNLNAANEQADARFPNLRMIHRRTRLHGC